MPTISSQTIFAKHSRALDLLFDPECTTTFRKPSGCRPSQLPTLNIPCYKTDYDKISDSVFRLGKVEITRPHPEVTGRDRAKFFDITQPVRPAVSAIGFRADLRLRAEYRRAAAAVNDSCRAPCRSQRLSGPVDGAAVTQGPVSRGTQTLYRDSETQTDPYSPPYRLGATAGLAEVLTLTALTWGSGLPPGVLEMELVTRLRNRRAWSDGVPPGSGVQHSQRRVELANRIERQQWALRETEIDEIHVLRMELMRRMQREQEERRQCRVESRLQRQWAQRCQSRDRQITKIDARHAREMRRLERVRESKQHMYPSLRRCEAMRPYLKRGASHTTGDKSSHGDAKCRQWQPNPYLQTRTGLTQLEQYCGDTLISSVVQLPRAPPSHLIQRRFYKKHRVLKELNDLYRLIQADKRGTPEYAGRPRLLVPVERVAPPPATPAHQLPVPPAAAEQLRLTAVRQLQRLTRGQAIGCRLERGLLRRRQLVDEVRTAHALRGSQMAAKLSEQRRATTMQRLRDAANMQDRSVDEALSRIEGATVSRLLTLLNNELIRLQEERKIQAFCMLAERERQMREAAEAGLRQKELRRRRELDEVFKREMKVHQSSVDLYLEDVILESVDECSDQTARDRIRQLTANLNSMADSRDAGTDADSLAACLVHSFLLPEVQRIETRRQIRQHAGRELAAARDLVTAQLGATAIPQVDTSVAERQELHRLAENLQHKLDTCQ